MADWVTVRGKGANRSPTRGIAERPKSSEHVERVADVTRNDVPRRDTLVDIPKAYGVFKIDPVTRQPLSAVQTFTQIDAADMSEAFHRPPHQLVQPESESPPSRVLPTSTGGHHARSANIGIARERGRARKEEHRRHIRSMSDNVVSDFEARLQSEACIITEGSILSNGLCICKCPDHAQQNIHAVTKACNDVLDRIELLIARAEKLGMTPESDIRMIANSDLRDACVALNNLSFEVGTMCRSSIGVFPPHTNPGAFKFHGGPQLRLRGVTEEQIQSVVPDYDDSHTERILAKLNAAADEVSADLPFGVVIVPKSETVQLRRALGTPNWQHKFSEDCYKIVPFVIHVALPIYNTNEAQYDTFSIRVSHNETELQSFRPLHRCTHITTVVYWFKAATRVVWSAIITRMFDRGILPLDKTKPPVNPDNIFFSFLPMERYNETLDIIERVIGGVGMEPRKVVRDPHTVEELRNTVLDTTLDVFSDNAVEISKNGSHTRLSL